MSGTIRPVTSRVPSSWEVWDQTQLPLAVTVQPLWRPPPPPRGRNSEDTEEHIVYTPPPLQQIPKCQHCGAPHPDENTQTVLSRPSARRIVTDEVGTSASFDPSSKSKANSHATTFLCYLCHKISTAFTPMASSQHSSHYYVNLVSTSNGGKPSAMQSNGDDAAPNASTDAWTFALPLRLHPPSSEQHELVYRVPALTCPLLWYIVLDGTTTAAWYWTHVSQCLQATFADIPSHVHVAIVLAYPGQQFGLFQIESTVPHVRRYPVAAGADWATILVEAAAPVQQYRSNLQAIAKACAQIPLPPPFTTTPSSSSSSSISDNATTTITNAASWMWLVEQIAAGLVELGQPAGQRKAPNRTWLPYAGAFGTCFRASDTTLAQSESLSLLTHLAPSRRQYALARLCAQAVLTLQTVFVIDPAMTDPWHDIVYENPPILSSVEAPALAWYASTEVTTTQGWATWQATWPWRKSIGYGGNVRLRTSPGLVVATDDDDDEEGSSHEQRRKPKDGNAIHKTTRLLPKDGGLTGPAVAAPESECLWTLPSLDPHTTLVIDLALDDDVDLSSSTSDAPRPKIGMLQVCVAYTALEADEDGKAWTVRRIKVAHRALQRVATVESLYRRVDPEALAVVLLHKLVRCAADQRGSIGEEWLEAFLVSVYQSAIEEHKRQEHLLEHGIADTDGYFIPAERLLSIGGGELSPTDILLAQGHGRLRPIVLLLFLLLQQCQASNNTASDLSLDRDGLSLSDLVRMSPDSLTRCLAPRLQLWSNDDVLVDLIDLCYETMVNTIREEAALLKNPRDSLLLVLDAPDQIIVANARAFLPGSTEAMNKLPARLGSSLQSTLKDMVASYPTPPPIFYGGSGSWLTEVCKEDSPLGSASDFGAWRTKIAKTVHTELVQQKIITADSTCDADAVLEV